MSERGNIVWVWVLAICVLAVAAALLLPLIARPTNCGGNNAALAACRFVVSAFEIVGMHRDDKPVTTTDLNEKERDNFRHPVGINWLGGAAVLVTGQAVVISETRPKTIIAVCTAADHNVPRRWIGKSPMTHAVAYSDGSVGLISVPDFQGLDLSRFADVVTIAEGRVQVSGAANRGQPVRSETNRTSSAAGRGR
jgi:hypothetical protein